MDRIELATESGQRVDRTHQLEVEDLDGHAFTPRLAVCVPHLTETTLTDHPVEMEPGNIGRLGGVVQRALEYRRSPTPRIAEREYRPCDVDKISR